METLQFEFEGAADPDPAAGCPALAGVVASGNLEVLLESRDLGGRCRFDVRTAADGFGAVWQAVLADFMQRHRLRNVLGTINDYAASPAVVSLRLDQAAESFAGPES